MTRLLELYKLPTTLHHVIWQGLGGMISAILSIKFSKALSEKWWLLFGIGGVLARTWGWTLSLELMKFTTSTNVAVAPYIFANFLYGFASNCAVIALSSLLQGRALHRLKENAATLMGFQRFSVRLAGVVTKIWVTAIIATYEYHSSASESEKEKYENAFTAISGALTGAFILPQFMCFIYMHWFEKPPGPDGLRESELDDSGDDDINEDDSQFTDEHGDSDNDIEEASHFRNSELKIKRQFSMDSTTTDGDSEMPNNAPWLAVMEHEKREQIAKAATEARLVATQRTPSYGATAHPAPKPAVELQPVNAHQATPSQPDAPPDGVNTNFPPDTDISF